MAIKDAQKQMRRHKHDNRCVARRTVFVFWSSLPIAGHEVTEFEHARPPDQTPVKTDGPQRPCANPASYEVSLDDG